jgi:hypothetical protein
MTTKRRNRREALGRVKDSLVEGWLALPDEDLGDQVRESGAEPDEVRSRVLHAYQAAKRRVAKSAEMSAPVERDGNSRVLKIDARRARAILKDVASRIPADALPWRTAAQLEKAQTDEDALRAVGELKDLGLVSDEELKK